MDVDWRQAGNSNMHSKEFTSCFTHTGYPHFPTSFWPSWSSSGTECFPKEGWRCSCHNRRVTGGQSHCHCLCHCSQVVICILTWSEKSDDSFSWAWMYVGLYSFSSSYYSVYMIVFLSDCFICFLSHCVVFSTYIQSIVTRKLQEQTCCCMLVIGCICVNYD